MLLDKGYWRNIPNKSGKVLKCNDTHSQSDFSRCIGESESRCEAGFKGPICINCRIHANRIRCQVYLWKM